MADSLPVPAGATLGTPIGSDSTSAPQVDSQPQSSGALPVPAGATLGQPISTPRTPATGALGVLSGIGGAALETVEGAKNLANKVLPAGAQIPDIPKEYRENDSTSEKIGGGIENIAEFMMGDAGLEGLAKAAKITEMADKYPLIAKTIAMAKEHPVLAKIIGNTAKSSAVGAAQGGVEGAAEGKGTEGAIGGAIGGAAGELTAETASAVFGELAKKIGIGTTAIEDAKRGAKPGKRNYKFADDFGTAAPLIDAENSASPEKAKSLEDWADATGDARKRVWAEQVQPLVERHKDVPLSGTAIADSIRSKIPPAMKKYSPVEAAKMESLANEFIPNGQLGSRAMAPPSHNTFVGDAEQALEHYNALVSKTGYWSKMPSERAALLKADGELSGNLATADAIRDELYNRLSILEPQSDLRQMKQQYGALRNVENELRGQVNVQGRQSPMSLKQAIGLITGVGAGGLGGVIAAAIPHIDSAINGPEKVFGRAVQKAARPEEGTVGKVIQKTASAANKVIAPTVAVAGENVGESLAPDRVTFKASDGSIHSVPTDQIHKAKQIDPNLQIMENGPTSTPAPTN